MLGFFDGKDLVVSEVGEFVLATVDGGGLGVAVEGVFKGGLVLAGVEEFGSGGGAVGFGVLFVDFHESFELKRNFCHHLLNQLFHRPFRLPILCKLHTVPNIRFLIFSISILLLINFMQIRTILFSDINDQYAHRPPRRPPNLIQSGLEITDVSHNQDQHDMIEPDIILLLD